MSKTGGRQSLGAAADNSAPAIETRGLRKHFQADRSIFRQLLRRKRVLAAVDGVSLTLKRGEILALVGESGCGKTTFAKLILGLLKPTAGEVVVFDRKLESYGSRIATTVQMVFQQGRASLNPRIKIGALLREVVEAHGLTGDEAADVIVCRVLQMVDLDSTFEHRYAHQLSGGQAQRVVVARALALQPRILIADEPTSALDVSIQARILNLLLRIRKELNLSMLLVTHNLGSVRQVADRVAVMYLGRIVELGPTDAVFETPVHPYTKALLDAAPVPDPAGRKAATVLRGETPNPVDRPSGCSFHPRCPGRQPLCSQTDPQYRERYPGHFAACHFPLGR